MKKNKDANNTTLFKSHSVKSMEFQLPRSKRSSIVLSKLKEKLPSTIHEDIDSDIETPNVNPQRKMLTERTSPYPGSRFLKGVHKKLKNKKSQKNSPEKSMNSTIKNDEQSSSMFKRINRSRQSTKRSSISQTKKARKIFALQFSQSLN